MFWPYSFKFEGSLFYFCPNDSIALEVGMAFPWKISFLEESRSRGIAKLHSSGIEEYEIYSSGSSGNFRGMSYPKNTENPPRLQKSFKKNSKINFSPECLFQSSEYLVMIQKIDW